MPDSSRVLVVDDDHSILRLLELALSQAGCQVVSASSGTDGLSEVVKADFSAVVTDISMPGMTGIELIEAISSLKPELPVLVLSAHAEYELVMEAIQKGAFDYITKDKENKGKTCLYILPSPPRRVRSRRMSAAQESAGFLLYEFFQYYATTYRHAALKCMLATKMPFFQRAFFRNLAKPR